MDATKTRVPEELELEILTWVPGEELARCKCVCKRWKPLIGSPSFLPLYRERNRCLVAYCWEDGRLHFWYSPIRRHRTDPDEPFRELGSLPDPLTHPVNGVICQGDGDVQLTVRSVFTREGLRVPLPPQYGGDTLSLYNLGYNPMSRRYKLLRLMFRVNEEGLVLQGHRMKAEVITLGPTGTEWQWRQLDDDGAGIRPLPVGTPLLYNTVRSYGALMCSGDGALCWLHKTKGMILFDMHRERFRWVKLPSEVHAEKTEDRRTMVPRVRFSDDKPLEVHLWVLPARGDKFKPEIECFLLEDEEGNVWKKSSEALGAELHDSASWYGIVNGSPSPDDDESIMLMNSSASSIRQLYCTNGMRRFWVGQPPQWNIFDSRNQLGMRNGLTRFSCLLDSNVLYLPLSDVLNGNGLE